ncbi:MAG: MMPL family transporter, partial [Rhodobacteraceae bacterium]|nr:MMPL family transporter [Paracoccaceae bacterium]
MKIHAFPEFLIRFRWIVIASTLIVMLGTSVGIGFFGVTNDYRSLFDDDNPQVVLLDALENIYGKSEKSIIAIEPKGQSVFQRDVLAAIESLTDSAWQVPYSTRVDSLTNYLHSWAEEDDLIVEELVIDAPSLSDEEVMRINEIAMSDNDVAGRLASMDGRVAGLVINYSLPEGHSDEAVFEITDYLSGMLEQARAENPDINYYLTGEIPLNRAFSDATNDDLETLIPIVLLVIAVIATLLLRSLLGMAALMAVVIFSVNMVMGFAGWLGVVFNPANAGVPIIVMTVAVAHAVHIVESTLAGLSRGLDRRAAVVEAMQHNIWPIFLTSLTTIIGFLSLNASDSPPFRVLGNLVAFGVFWTFLFSLTLLPALLAVMPLKSSKRISLSSKYFDRFSSFV